MSRLLTKQGSMEIYWKKEGGGERGGKVQEQTHGIGALFFNSDAWGDFKQLRGGLVRKTPRCFPTPEMALAFY